MKIIYLLCCFLIAFAPLDTCASESSPNTFQISLNPNQSECIGPAESMVHIFTMNNRTSSTIAFRLDHVKNNEKSELYSVLQAILQTQENVSPMTSLEKLTTDWYQLSPGESMDLKLTLYLPDNIGNCYQNSTLNALFVFEYRTPQSVSVQADGTTYNSSADISGTSGSLITVSPHTGDQSTYRTYLCICTISLLFAVLKHKKMRSKNEAS